MKKLFFCLTFAVLFVSSCATHGPFYVGYPYGASVPYGEGRHPGIDFDISKGTPIIACSDGEVVYIGEPDAKERHGGGIFVEISHGEYFKSLYGHLTRIFVEKGQSLKRGQLIGLSGASNSGYQHLHFGICKIGGSCKNYSQTYDLKTVWYGGQPRCFDPKMDYSAYSQKDITLPVACAEYAKELIAEIKK
jgi:murein DD-endopeptidase MepM/ murein hydrolase activator NlpD